MREMIQSAPTGVFFAMVLVPLAMAGVEEFGIAALVMLARWG